MIFVSSWDDGHPLDERLANLLVRHGLKGTFYVPLRNRERRDVMPSSQMRELDAAFEVGSHTLDHIYLTELSAADSTMQIQTGKQGLEDILGHLVPGFCYPGGMTNRRIRQEVLEAGFSHARTISNLWLDPVVDAFSIPTTVQFYPHPPRVLWRNFVSGGHYFSRVKALQALATGKDRFVVLRDLATRCAASGHVLHVWGHSWEIEQNGLWAQLDGFLSHVASLEPSCMTVTELGSWQSTGAPAKAST